MIRYVMRPASHKIRGKQEDNMAIPVQAILTAELNEQNRLKAVVIVWSKGSAVNLTSV